MPMLSKSQIKAISSLQSKKLRQKYAQFIVEGEKSILELKDSANYQIETIVSENEMPDSILKEFSKNTDIQLIENTNASFRKITMQNTPSGLLAVIKIPKIDLNAVLSELKSGLHLFLDTIQDPGNLGTIIRTADWFGIKNILANEGCADLYNPKTIQASMGSFSRVNFIPADLNTLKLLKEKGMIIIGATLDGENASGFKFPENSMLVMGNEGQGISPEILKILDRQITITKTGFAESLNVAIATSILCYEYSAKAQRSKI
jgi:RNA methyltransferase, TrmH family